ncbi:MAG: glycoside hydrolase family 13 protein [Janthinobacterium lividum]
MVKFLLTTVLLLLAARGFAQPTPPAPATTGQTWWKEAVVYQIYPRSYQDSNGDGVGDIRGIISHLDYVKSLGVNVIWLNPSYASPNADNGYDISDYRQIQPEYGTMADFDALLKGLHQRGIKLVMDLVVNHSSDEHAWFKAARTSRTNPYYTYYHWWPAEKGKPPKRYSAFDVNDDAWAYNKATNSYYLHYFAAKQPDLNWENPQLRQEIYSMMRFWFDKGIDGFRMDVIPFISKDTNWPPLPEKYHGDYFMYYANGPHLHEYLQEMNREVLSKYDVMSVAEGAGVTSDQALLFVDPACKELNMLYHFEGTGVKYVPSPTPPTYDLREFKQVYSKWEQVFADKGWGTVYLGNHDQPRMLSRWGDDRPEFREAAAKLLTTFLLTMHDTPYYYEGDELGMNNIKFDNVADYRDIETLTRYQQVKNKGGDLPAFMDDQKRRARDNARTPMQWDAAANAGFTTGTPWIKVNPNYPQVNVAVEDKNPTSILNYFRHAVATRQQHKVLVYGQYALLDEANPHIYAYTRTLGPEKVLVVLNFSPDKHDWSLPPGLTLSGQPWLNNYPAFTAGSTLAMQPWQAVVLPLR